MGRGDVCIGVLVLVSRSFAAFRFINSLRYGAFPTVPYAKLADKTQRSTSSEMAAAKGRGACGGIKFGLVHQTL